MGFAVTEPREKPRRAKQTPREKTASRDFFANPNKTRPANRLQPLKTQQGKPAYAYKTASGRPFWPSRDPIGENGGYNLYAFVKNDPVMRVDRLGWERIPHIIPGLTPVFPRPKPNPVPPSTQPSQGRSLPDLTVDATGGIRVGGCGIYGPGAGAKICLAGSITVSVGTCCDGDNKRKSLTVISGELEVSGGVAAGQMGGIEIAPIAKADLGFQGDCPSDLTDEVKYRVCINAEAGFGQGSCCWEPNSGWSCSGGFQITKGLSVTVSGAVSYNVKSVE